MISAYREEALDLLVDMVPGVDMELAERFIDCLIEAAVDEACDQVQVCGIDSPPAEHVVQVGMFGL